MGVEHAWNDSECGKSDMFRIKTVTVPFCPSQVPHRLAWDQTTGSLTCKKYVHSPQWV